MNVTKESENPTEVTLNIELDNNDEEPFLNRSYRRLVTRIRIPGFRPGKAPRSIVESHVGRPALVQEALEFMIPETLDQVLKDENLQAFSEPRLELIEVEPVQFKAVVPLEPIVELGDFRVIRLEREVVEVTDEQVDEVVEELRQESAPWEPADRPAQFGDLLNLDLKAEIQGESVIDEQGIDMVLRQDSDMPAQGFPVYLEGMTEGQDKDFSLPLPEEYIEDREDLVEGAEFGFSVKLHSIKSKLLPELDDEFAKEVGNGYDSLEDLRAEIRQRLTANAQAVNQREFEQTSLDELLKTATFQVSDLLYQQEAEAITRETEQRLKSQQLDFANYLTYAGKTQEQWLEDLRPDAEQRLNTYLALRKLAEEEGLEVSEDDVDAEFDTLLTEINEGEIGGLVAPRDNPQVRESLRSSLLNRKVMERLTEIFQGERESETQEPEATAETETEEIAPEDPAAEEEGAESDVN